MMEKTAPKQTWIEQGQQTWESLSLSEALQTSQTWLTDTVGLTNDPGTWVALLSLTCICIGFWIAGKIVDAGS